MVLNGIYLEYNEAFLQQIKLLVRIKQIVILSATIVRLQHIQEIRQVKILFPDILLVKDSTVVSLYKLVESVEGRFYLRIRLDTLDVERHGIGECHLLGAGGRLVVLLPQGKQQGLDALSLLYVKYFVIGIERIERYRILIRIGEIDAVLTARLAVYHLAQALIGITGVNEYDMRTLLIILPCHMVCEE